MPISLSQLAADIAPQKTVLFFGAGSSIPSGAPSVSELKAHLTAVFHTKSEGYSLSELTGIIENKTKNRKSLISAIRDKFNKTKPTGGLLNVPLYDWKAIYTTNYDILIEQAYDRTEKLISVFASNFDFNGDDTPGSTKLFKLHGTINKDIADGYHARWILTDGDYDKTQDYRELLYDRLRSDLAGAHLIIIGHSLADEHIKEEIQRAVEINTKSLASGRISLLMFNRDDDRAALYEARGLRVAFGGIDNFFAEVAGKMPSHHQVYSVTGDPIDRVAGLRPITTDVAHASAAAADVASMFNGWPATFADIASGLTFSRTVAKAITEEVTSGNVQFAAILGPSGLGKTTAIRQTLHQLLPRYQFCWEHKADYPLQANWWIEVADELRKTEKVGILFVDDAHHHLNSLNEIIETLGQSKNTALKLICASSRNHWGPRVKSPYIYKLGKEFLIQKLDTAEIDDLLNLVDQNAQIRPLIEQTFSGFSRTERRRRLIDRCESETFVCLKNIFANEKFDDIILREYASLENPLQEIYKFVAAMENAGIHVHRQLVIRVLGIAADKVSSALSALEDIIEEYDIDTKIGIYGWKGRHPVIVGIIAKYKFGDKTKLIELFGRVIDSISPTYDIEVRSIRELCNIETGLPSISDKNVQNTLLRRLMSVAPGERVPRHRLIRNLIDMNEFEKAETEIRIFEKDFGSDGPVAKYKLSLMVARATHSPGIMKEDRIAILEQARSYATAVLERYRNNKNFLLAYCDLGIAYFKHTARYDVFDEAIKEIKSAEERLGDPDISRQIRFLEQRMSGQTAQTLQ